MNTGETAASKFSRGEALFTTELKRIQSTLPSESKAMDYVKAAGIPNLKTL
jgi:hypothetical protein